MTAQVEWFGRSMAEARAAGDWWCVLGKGWHSACPAVRTAAEALDAARKNHPSHLGERVTLAICTGGSIGCEVYMTMHDATL